ncbi:unnamed protein product [Cylindrotheca closterium]|uniref:Uncharacterized protein n=1 Tax=Cylindrotheca closterium TaxID=2856 RepID=A0AAD2FLD4_9STRA|nr:unnamed protein product [Cylindrotheca closterium]
MNRKSFELVALSLLWLTVLVDGFSTQLGPLSSFPSSRCFPFHQETVALMAAGKKKRRRRKEPPSTAAPEPEQAVSPEVSSPPISAATPSVEQTFESAEDIDPEDVDVDILADIANFKFEGSDPTVEEAVPQPDSEESLPLPDIKQALQKKAMEQMAKAEEEEKQTQVKINRKDKKAFAKLLEQDPYADADDSFFEEEEYGTVSALLGERAKPFLGIPTGPLQVGHTIGALVIVLMAFVEYPGFPLTNLPSAIRGALQGGLGTVYAINAIFAILAVFKAGERGQPALLWVAKTFTVGGLAYDQLTQLPTTEEIERVKNQKGARALKNRKN